MLAMGGFLSAERVEVGLTAGAAGDGIDPAGLVLFRGTEGVDIQPEAESFEVAAFFPADIDGNGFGFLTGPGLDNV